MEWLWALAGLAAGYALYRVGRSVERRRMQAETDAQKREILSEVDAARQAVASDDDTTLRDELRRGS